MTEGRFKTVFFTFSIALIACMGYMVCGTWIGWSSTAIYQIKHNKTELVVTNYGTMIAMYDLGNMISPIPCGYLLGLIGRKLTISVIGPMNMIAWITILTWPSRLDVLYVARLFAGLAKGMTICSVPMYVGEIAEVKLRGAVLSMVPMSLAFGMLTTQTIGQFLTYRQLNFMGLSFSTVFTVLFLMMPESPYYLMQKDRKDQAEKSLRRIRAKDDVADELAMIEETVTKQMQSKATYKELFMNKSNRRAFIITLGACVFQRLSGISPFIHFTSITLPSKNYWVNPLVAVVVFSVIKNVGNLVPFFLVDWIGRKPLMVISHSAMALATVAYGVGLYVVANVPGGSSLAWWPVVLLWLYVLSYSLGAGTLAYLLLGEMFAANIKTKAAPLCVILQSSASFMQDSTYTFISHAFGVHFNYFIYSAFNLIWAVAAVFIMVETKGKTFLEIEQMLAA